MSSKSALVCNRRAWEAIHMAKLIMITLCNTAACTSYCEERARGQPGGGHCEEGHHGPSGWKDMLASAVGAHRRAAQSWGEPPRSWGEPPRAEGSCQSWGEPPRAEGVACSLRPCRTALQGHFSKTSQASRRRQQGSIGIASEPSFLPFPFHSAPYPSLAWSAGPPHYTSYKLIFDSEFAQGSWPRPWLHLHYHV